MFRKSVTVRSQVVTLVDSFVCGGVEDLRSPHAFVGSVMPLILSLIVVTFITTGRLEILLTVR